MDGEGRIDKVKFKFKERKICLLLFSYQVRPAKYATFTQEPQVKLKLDGKKKKEARLMRLGGEVRCQGHMTLKFSQLHPPWLCSWFEFPRRTNMHILSFHFQGLKGKEWG